MPLVWEFKARLNSPGMLGPYRYIYLHGFIWYDDEFGKHTTRFCYYFDTKHEERGLQLTPTNNHFD